MAPTAGLQRILGPPSNQSDGQSRCEYVFYYGVDCVFDPAIDCAKDPTVTYRCGDGPTEAFYLPPEAGFDSDIIMSGH